MQGILPTDSTLDTGTSSFTSQSFSDLNIPFLPALNNAKGLLLGLFILTIILKVGGLFSKCLDCFIVQCLFKIILVFVMLSWTINTTLTKAGTVPSIWLCNLYSVMPSVLFTITIAMAQFLASLVPIPAFIKDIATVLAVSIVLTVVLRYSTQQLNLRVRKEAYDNSLWNFYQ